MSRIPSMSGLIERNRMLLTDRGHDLNENGRKNKSSSQSDQPWSSQAFRQFQRTNHLQPATFDDSIASQASSMGILDIDKMDELSYTNDEKSFNIQALAETDVSYDSLPDHLLQPSYKSSSSVDLDGSYRTSMDLTPRNLCSGSSSLESTRNGNETGSTICRKSSRGLSSNNHSSSSSHSFTSNNSVFDSSMMNQVATEFGHEDFCQSVDNLQLIDEAERQFEKSVPPIMSMTNVSMMAGDTGPMTHATLPLNESVQAMSQSVYFMQNNSRIGSLEIDEDEKRTSQENRPDLGLGKIISPKNKPVRLFGSNDDPRQIQTQTTSMANETYVHHPSSGPLSENLKTIRDFLSAANIDPAVFASMLLPQNKPKLEKFVKSLTSSGLNETSGQLSETVNLLPSFLETTNLNDLTSGFGPEAVMPPPQKSTAPMRSVSNSIRARTSSPRKPLPAPDNRLQTQPFKVESLPPASSSTSSMRFPITSDKKNLTWFNVAPNEASLNTLMIFNTLETSKQVLLKICDTDKFKFADSNSDRLEFEMTASMQKAISIIFTAEQTGWHTGKLVIKMKAALKGPGLKAVLGLHASCGKAHVIAQCIAGTNDVIVIGEASVNQGYNLREVFPGQDVKALKLINSGSAPSFVQLQMFKDGTCKMLEDNAAVIPDSFILAPGENRTVDLRFECPKRPNFEANFLSCHLQISTGSETFRQALKLCGTNNVKVKVEPNLISNQNSSCCDLTNLKSVQLTERDLFQFISDHCQRSVLSLKGYLVSLATASKLSPLPVELTFNESQMMLNTTTVVTTPTTIQRPETIAEENDDAQLVDVSDTGSLKSDRSSAGTYTSQSEKKIFLEQDKLFFPPTAITGSSEMKLKIRNKSGTAVVLHVVGLRPPFASRVSQIEVIQSTLLPIQFLPTSVGPQSGTIELHSPDGTVTLKAILKGYTVKSKVR